MLSRVFHIENSNFTFLPNPTPDSWDKRSVSLPKILEAFYIKSQHDCAGMKHRSLVIARYRSHIEEILQYLDDENSLHRWLLLRALHAALDDADDVLTARTKLQRQTSHDAAENISEKTYDQASDAEKHMRRREIVQDVLRHHIQEVLRLLNQQDDPVSDTLSVHPPPSIKSRPRPPLPRFEEMDAAGPDDRQDIFMDVYFDVIRPHVVSTATHSTTNRRSSIVGAPPGLSRALAGSIRSNRSNVSLLTPQSPTRDSMIKGGDHFTREVVMDDANVQLEIHIPQDDYVEAEEIHSGVSLAELDVSHDEVWCTLVFRMVCWLMLHNFNKKDVQLPKSELYGSRMPIYIE